MPATISKLTKKYQAIIPESVGKDLSLQAGDSVLIDIEYLQELQGTQLNFS
jgi:bifunctional DNA-binding transcriptional regulator/antitoxin component of YhaV-PrlF toxin-antitoxin module